MSAACHVEVASAPLRPRARPDGRIPNAVHAAVWSSGQDQVAVIKRRMIQLVPTANVFLDVDDLEDSRAPPRSSRPTARRTRDAA